MTKLSRMNRVEFATMLGRRKPRMTRFIVFVIASLSSAFVVAAAGGNGGSPKGQSFVAIGDHIVQVESAISSLEDQIAMLIGRVDSIEARVGANEVAIALSESSNASLQVLIEWP